MKDKISVIGKLLLFLLVIGVVLIIFGFYTMVNGGLLVGIILMVIGVVILQRVLLYKRFKFGLEFSWEIGVGAIIWAILFIMLAIFWLMEQFG